MENVCWKSCVTNYQLEESEENVEGFIDKFENCLKECTAGSREVLKLSKKHSEISWMTLDWNLRKCDQIYKEDPLKLMNCYVENIDKIERWFFGYY